MRSRIIIGAVIGLSFFSCANYYLTQGGARVQIVTEKQKECCCAFIDVVAVSEMNIAFSADDKVQDALIEARNRVAKLGGNAMRILSIDTNRKEVLVVVEALKYDFDEMNIDKNPR